MDTITEFKQPKQLTKENFEKETGFPLNFAFFMLCGSIESKEVQELASQVFNLAMRLTGYNGLDDQMEFISHLKEAYDNFQKWQKDNCSEQAKSDNDQQIKE